MPRLTANDFHPAVMKLFDQYVHGRIDRRGFLSGAAKYAVGGVSATMLLDMLKPRYAEATQIAKDDPRVQAKLVEYNSPEGSGKMRGYLAMPGKMTGKLPAVLVVHENRGLNPHIEDIARRLAVDNFIAFAPDALFPLGGYPGDDDKAAELFGKLDHAKTRMDFLAGALFMKALPACSGKYGVVGFCYGGGIANVLATKLPDLGAAVPFYGAAPRKEDVRKIKATLLINYASDDAGTDAMWPAYEAALKAAGVKYEMYIYPDTVHGFNNDTTPRFNEKAAKLAWERTMGLFNRSEERRVGKECRL